MENTKKIFSIFSFEKKSKNDLPQEMNCEVFDDSVIEIVEKDDIIVNQTVINFVQTLPFQQNENKLQHSDLGNLATGPYRPVLNAYKQTRFGSQNRSFSSEWYKQYTWLEYSMKSNAAICYVCRMFTDELIDEVWTKKGFSNWQKLNEKLKKHAKTKRHLVSVTKMSGHLACILSSIHKLDFIIVLHILNEVLSIIYVLSNQLQFKSATLGTSRTKSKRKRQEPPQCETECRTTGNEHWKIIYFQIIDSVIVNLKYRISDESLVLANSLEQLIKMDFEKGSYFINHYKDVVNIDLTSLKVEMLLTKNCIQNRNLDFDILGIKKVVTEDVFLNLFKLV
ncbi:hypothetical protein QTP88_012041 [Uroleucon formosanum]